MMLNYIDGQFKIKMRIDDLKLNQDAEDAADKYLLSYLPKLKQETLTAGTSWKDYETNIFRQKKRESFRI